MHAARTCDAALAPVHPLLKVHLRHLTSWAELSSFEKIKKKNAKSPGSLFVFSSPCFSQNPSAREKKKKELTVLYSAQTKQYLA